MSAAVDESCEMTEQYAAPAMRDRFLTAVDNRDWALSIQLAKHLTGCTNPLPGSTCQQLDLPSGSTYGCAADRVLLMHTASTVGAP